MHDIRSIRENPQAFDTALKRRGLADDVKVARYMLSARAADAAGFFYERSRAGTGRQARPQRRGVRACEC